MAVTASGQVLINKSPLAANDVKSDCRRLAARRRWAGGSGDRHQCRRQGHHQSVVDVMQAAQTAGYPHISFATQNRRA